MPHRRRRRVTVGKFTRAFLWLRSPYCGICGAYVDFEDATIDHRRPVSKGGTDSPDNLQIAHPACNVAKGNREEC